MMLKGHRIPKFGGRKGGIDHLNGVNSGSRYLNRCLKFKALLNEMKMDVIQLTYFALVSNFFPLSSCKIFYTTITGHVHLIHNCVFFIFCVGLLSTRYLLRNRFKKMKYKNVFTISISIILGKR